MLDRVEKQGSIVDFLDDWEPVFVRMCHHRDTIARCKDADVEYERKAQPGWLKIDCDFAENFTILKKRQLQSQYWSQLQCTIFVCVVSFVDKATFDDTAVALAEGDEVTVVTDAGHSFWAKVEQVDHTGTDTRYHVRDALGNGTLHARASLHKRIWVTTALIGFTSDRKHDSYATQFFLNKALDFAATEHRSQGFTEVHIHSDNAGSAR